MKNAFLTITAIALAMGVSSVAIADVALATAKNCMACHAMEKKVVGPSYKDVAAKYAGQADAIAKLSGKIIKGGGGVWGPVPMPANAQVSADEATKLATWIMAQK